MLTAFPLCRPGDARRRHNAVPDCAGFRQTDSGLRRGGGVGIVYPPHSVNALTLRQITTPPNLMGRVNATLDVVERGVIPFGALAGGMLGDAIGLRPTLLVASVGIALAAVWAACFGLARSR
jgi:hypothetical protein